MHFCFAVNSACVFLSHFVPAPLANQMLLTGIYIKLLTKASVVVVIVAVAIVKTLKCTKTVC